LSDRLDSVTIQLRSIQVSL